jgi:hypothetical protein
VTDDGEMVCRLGPKRQQHGREAEQGRTRRDEKQKKKNKKRNDKDERTGESETGESGERKSDAKGDGRREWSVGLMTRGTRKKKKWINKDGGR